MDTGERCAAPLTQPAGVTLKVLKIHTFRLLDLTVEIFGRDLLIDRGMHAFLPCKKMAATTRPVECGVTHPYVFVYPLPRPYQQGVTRDHFPSLVPDDVAAAVTASDLVKSSHDLTMQLRSTTNWDTAGIFLHRMKTYSCAATDPSDASRGRGLFWIPVINEHPLVWERGGRRECVANPCNRSALTGLISTFRNGNGIPFIEAGQGVDHFYFT